MFSVGTYFKIWGVTDKGNYAEVECSTNKKNNQTGNYETDFSSKFVRFIGEAYRKRPQPNERIKVTNCAVQNVYVKDGQMQYLKNPTYLVFDFERDVAAGQPRVSVPNANGNGYTPSAYGSPNFAQSSPNFEEITLGDDSLPFD